MAATYPEVEIYLIAENGDKQFEFNSRQAGRILGDVPLSEFVVVRWLKGYIGEGLKEIFGGVLDEVDN